MTLSAHILFILGVLAELIFLYENANASKIKPIWETGNFIQRLVTPGQTVVFFLALIAGLLVGIFELTGVGRNMVFIDTPFIGLIDGALLLLVLFAAFMASWFLPPINEQSMLVIQFLLLAGSLLYTDRVVWIPLWMVTIIPGAVSLLLVLWPVKFSPQVKAILYLWYLLSLMAIPFQSSQTYLINQPDPTWAQAYTSGMLLVFLILHGLFAARFIAITLSMILPRNHALVARAMPALFHDEQMPLIQTLAVTLLLAGLLAANQLTHAVETPLALSLCSLLAVHLLSRKISPEPLP